MTDKEAWFNIRERLIAYEKEHGWTEDDIHAEVRAYGALCGAKCEKCRKEKKNVPLLREKDLRAR